MCGKKKKQHGFQLDPDVRNEKKEQNNCRKLQMITTIHPMLNDQEVRSVEMLIREMPNPGEKE